MLTVNSIYICRKEKRLSEIRLAMWVRMMEEPAYRCRKRERKGTLRNEAVYPPIRN